MNHGRPIPRASGPNRLTLGSALLLGGWIAVAFLWENRAAGTFADRSSTFTGFPFVKTTAFAGLAAASALIAARAPNLRITWEQVRRLTSTRWFLVFLYISVCSALLSDTSLLSILRLAQSLIPLFAAFIWIAVLGRRPLYLIWGISVAALIHMAIATAAWGTGNIELGGSMFHGRWGGLIHPVALGAAAVIVLILGLWSLLHHRRSWLSVAFIAISLLAIAISTPRGATIAGTVAVLYLLWTLRPRGVIFVVGATAGAAFLFAGGTLTEWFTRGRPNELLSFTGRLSFWDSLAPIIAEQPLIGWGPGALRIGSVGQSVGITQAHSAIFELLVNVGIVGTIAFAVWTLSASRRLWHSSDEDSTLYRALFIAMVLIAATEASPVGYSMTWMVVCVIMIVSVTPIRSFAYRATPWRGSWLVSPHRHQ